MKKGDIVIIFVSLSIMIGLFIVYKATRNSEDERFVEIRIKNELITSIKITQNTDMKLLILTKDNVYQDYKILESYEEIPNNISGFDLVYINKNGVQVLDADCPKRIIVKQGFRRHVDIPLICLPRQLEITIRSGNEVDEIDGFAYNLIID
jgi:hypothetical protein